jgi:hypothetical protein
MGTERRGKIREQEEDEKENEKEKYGNGGRKEEG